MATNLHTVAVSCGKSVRRVGEVILIDPVRSESAYLFAIAISNLALPPMPSWPWPWPKIILEEGLEDRGFLDHHAHDPSRDIVLFWKTRTLEDLCRTCELPESDVRGLGAGCMLPRRPGGDFAWVGALLTSINTVPRCFRCVDALGALCGNIGGRWWWASAHGFNTQRHFDKSVEAHDRPQTHHRTISRAATRAWNCSTQKEPAVRMLFVNSGNPVKSIAEFETWSPKLFTGHRIPSSSLIRC